MVEPTYLELQQQVLKLQQQVIDTQLQLREQRQLMICPLDYKYYDEKLAQYISGAATWRACAEVQVALMRGRLHFGKATAENVAEMEAAFKIFSPADTHDLEEKVTRQDQLAVLREFRKYVIQDTYDKMHPGTTSYDILDTARNLMFKRVAEELIKPKALELLKTLVNLAEEYENRIQVGRTHNQWTSPVTFGYTIAAYASRLDDRIDKLVDAADKLEGKISGIVATSASVATVLGREVALPFQQYVLEEILGLKVCRDASQVVSKEKLTDYAHAYVSMQGVLADMANTMRLLQSSEISEISGRETKARLGGSSADPSKNNPIQFENVAGVWEEVMSGMNVIYHLQVSDHSRDLRGSVQARFQPQHIIAIVYDSLKRMAKQMSDIVVNEEAMDRHLAAANRYPAEALNAVLKAYNFPDAHKTVQEFSKRAMRENRPLIEIALEDPEIHLLWETRITEEQRGHLENIRLYSGFAQENTVDIVTRIRQKHKSE